MTTILVTGGTGNNDKATLEQLTHTKLPVRAMLGDPAKGTVNAIANNHWFYVLALIFFALASLESATAASMDPFSGASPSFDSAPEDGTNYNTGDWGVSERNGIATYTFPIGIPPGRNGMVPSLSLRYSSNLPLRGGLAVGWAFSLPSIEVDLSLGVAEGEQYRIDLGNVAGRLVEVSDTSPYPEGTAYRVQFDNSNTRIFLTRRGKPRGNPGGWVALTPDGVRHHFEQFPGAHHKGVWNITRQVDPFGNTVRYIWSDLLNRSSTYMGQSLVRIEYTDNQEADLLPHAKIEFNYAPLRFCGESNIPIGAAYRKGSNQITGAQQLEAIKILVRDEQTSNWRLHKQVNLSYVERTSILYSIGATMHGATWAVGYATYYTPPTSRTTTSSGRSTSGIRGFFGKIFTRDKARTGDLFKEDKPKVRVIDCKQNPLRYLTQIDVKALDAGGTVTTLPPMKFQYNNRLNTSQPWSLPSENPMREITISSPGFGQEGISGSVVSGIQKSLLDIDNDGIRDRVSVIEENAVCTLVWNKGLLGGTFDTQDHKSALPTAPWYREWKGMSDESLLSQEACTLSGQIAYREQNEGVSGSLDGPLVDLVVLN